MRVFFITIVLILGFAGYLWYLGGDSVPAASNVKAQAEASRDEGSAAAEPGVYYLTEHVRVSTSGGMKDFPAGSMWELAGESGIALLLTDGENTFSVERSKTTQDPAGSPAAPRRVTSPVTASGTQTADLQTAAYQSMRQNLEKKIQGLQDRITNEQTKIRTAKGESSGTLGPDIKNLSHGARHAIQVAEGRIHDFQSEIAALKKEMALLVPPATNPEESPVTATPAPAVEVAQPASSPPGFISRIGLGFQRLLEKI